VRPRIFTSGSYESCRNAVCIIDGRHDDMRNVPLQESRRINSIDLSILIRMFLSVTVRFTPTALDE
jgi:hypothetical protein